MNYNKLISTLSIALTIFHNTNGMDTKKIILNKKVSIFVSDKKQAKYLFTDLANTGYSIGCIVGKKKLDVGAQIMIITNTQCLNPDIYFHIPSDTLKVYSEESIRSQLYSNTICWLFNNRQAWWIGTPILASQSTVEFHQNLLSRLKYVNVQENGTIQVWPPHTKQ